MSDGREAGEWFAYERMLVVEGKKMLASVTLDAVIGWDICL